MKIVSLKMENFKRIEAIEITPSGNTVLITGKNGAGKSSIIDGIIAVLCGKKYIPEKPIRDGEDHAEISITTENWIIKRTFTEGGGGSVTITGKSQDGMTSTANSPQKLLDKIKGSIAFDPMKFIAMGDTEAGKKEQRLMLMKLAGLDFADIDADIAGVKQVRADVRKDKERLEHEADRIAVADDTPDEEVSVVELVKQLQEIDEHNKAIMEKCISLNTERDVLHAMRNEAQSSVNAIEELKAELAIATKNLEVGKAAIVTKQERIEAATSEHEGMESKDPAPVQLTIDGSEKTNVNVRLKKQKADLTKQSEAKADEWRKLGQDAKALELKKAKRLSEAKMPLAGLSVTDDCVIMGKIPLSQVNGAEQLRVGLGIAMAENPELRVILMNGNDLDSDSLKVIEEMTAEKDFQVWVERIEGEGGIVIEDGMVKK